MKMLKAILGLTCLFLISGCSNNAEENVNDKIKEAAQPVEVEETNATTEKVQSIAISELSLIQDDSEIDLDITVPQLSGTTDTDVQTPFNEYFKNVGTEFENYVRTEATVPENAVGHMSFTTKLVNEQVISLLIRSTFYPGAGDDNEEEKIAYNYDLKSNQLLDFDSLFTEGSDYVSELYTLAQQEMGINTQDLSADFNLVDVIEGFYLTEDHLVIIFKDNELTASVLDVFEVAIYKNQLASLKEEYK